MSPFEDVIDLVNATLDGAGLADRLREVFTSPAAFESDLECTCLFTPGDPAIPLRIDTETNSCHCTRGHCPLGQRGNLVKLYAFARGRDIVAAALELADFGDLEVDPARLSDIETHYLMLTEEALLLENVPMAGRCFLTALLVCNTVEKARERVREMTGHLERAEDGAEFYLQFSAYLELKGQLEEAMRVLREEVLHLQPYRPEYQARLADLQRRMEPGSDAWAGTMLRVCDTLISSGKYDVAHRCLVRAQTVLPNLAQIHERLAEVFRGMEMDGEAEVELLAACVLYEKQGELRLALRILEQLVRENPSASEFRTRSSRLRLALRDKEGYARDIEALSRQALERGDSAAALAILEDAVRQVPDHLYIRGTLASLCRTLGRIDDCALHLLASVESLLQQEMFERAAEDLAMARGCGSSNPAVIEKAANLMATLGQLEEASDEFLAFGSSCLIAGERDRGSRALERIGELVPLDSVRIRKAAGTLDKHGVAEVSASILMLHARALADFGSIVEARKVLAEICGRGASIIREVFEYEEELAESDGGPAERRALVLSRLGEPAEHSALLEVIRRALALLAEGEGDVELADVVGEALRNPQLAGDAPRLLLEALEAEPDNQTFHALLIRIDTSTPVHAAQLADKLEARGQSNEAAAMLRGWLEEAKPDDPELACRMLARIVALVPDSLNDLLALQAAEQALGRTDKARELDLPILRATAANLGREALLERARGTLTLVDDPGPRAEIAALLAENGMGEEAADMAMETAALLDAAGREAEALALLRMAAGWNPRHVLNLEMLARMEEGAGNTAASAAVWHSLAELYQQDGNNVGECDACAELLRIEPGNNGVTARQAALLAVLGDVEQASSCWMTLAGRLKLPAEASARADAYIAAHALQPHNELAINGAIDALEEAKRGEESIPLRLGLAGSLAQAGDLQAAISFVQRSIGLQPQSVELRTMLLDLYTQASDYDGVADTAAQLATMHVARGDRNEAIVLLKSALIPLIESGAHENVLHVLAEHAELLAGSPNLMRYRALSLEGIGQRAEAASAWLGIADAHRHAGRDEEESVALGRAISLSPKDSSIRRRLIECLRRDEDSNITRIVHEYRELAALIETGGAREDLEVVYREILSVDHEDPDALERLAKLMLETGRDPEALSLFLRLGSASAASENWALADTAYVAATRLDQWNADALRGIRRVSRGLGDHPRLLEASALLAEVLDQQGEEEEALLAWQELASLDPSNRPARIRLAEMHLQRGNRERAIFLLREVIGLSEDSSSAEEVIDMLRRLDKLEPDDPLVLEQIGAAHLRAGDRAQGIEYLFHAAELLVAQRELEGASLVVGRLLDLQPSNAEWLAMQAEILVDLGLAPDASRLYVRLAESACGDTGAQDREKALSRAVSLDPSNIPARESWAVALREAGKAGEASRQLLEVARLRAGQENLSLAVDAAREAAAIDPAEPEVRLELAELQSRAGQRREAAETRLWLARHFWDSGNRTAARQHVDESIALHPTAESYLLSGAIEEDGGDEELSLRHYLKGADYAEKAGSKDLYGMALEGAARQFPANTDILRKLGIFLRAGGHFEVAADRYLRGVEYALLQGDIPMARHLQLEAAEVVGASRHLNRGAAEIYRRHDVPELAARSLVALGRDLLRDGEDSAALVELDKALELVPRDATALQLKFNVLRRLQQGQEAEQTGLQLSEAYVSSERLEEAVEVTRQVLDEFPESLQAREALAQLFERLGRTLEAVETLEQLAQACELQELWQEACDARTRQVRILPDNPDLRRRRLGAAQEAGRNEIIVEDCLALGDFMLAEEKPDEAEEFLGRVLDLEPERGEVQQKMVALQLARGETGPAVALSYKLARACIDKGDGAGAMAMLERIREHVRDDPEFHLLLGAVHHLARSRGLASREYRRALDLYKHRRDREQESFLLGRLLELDPLSLEIRQMQVDLLVESGAGDEAVDAMEKLAHVYFDRRLFDLAESEFRRVLSLKPERHQLWKFVFAAHLESGSESELIEEYLHYASLAAKDGNTPEAIVYFNKVATLDPGNLRARMGFVQCHVKEGRTIEVIDDILELAQMLVDLGRVDEGIGFFEMATAADPKNKKARSLLSATQARTETEMRRRLAQGPGDAPIVDPDMLEEMDFSKTQLVMANEKISASDLLRGTIDDLDRKENETTLQQIADEYQDMLAVNPANADLRLKLADVYQQMNRVSEMLKELEAASDTLFKNNDLSKCITACERFLRVRPDNAKLRRRLNEALLKRDALKALESAIMHDDEREPPIPPPRRR
jgi:tetratricopeptide (TPR) repeat protein